MVKVPSSDRVHVISAWIVPKEKTLNKINILGHGQATLTTDKYTEKPMPKMDTELFTYLFSLYLKIGRIQDMENKSKSSMYIIFERIGSCSPKLINKCLTIC